MEYGRVDGIVEPGWFRLIRVFYPVWRHLVTLEPVRCQSARVGFSWFEPSVLFNRFNRGAGRRSGR